MMKKKSLLFFCFLLLPYLNITAQERSFYYNQNNYAFTSPGAMKFGLYGYNNPSVLSTLHQFDIYFTWSDIGGFGRFKNWGLFTAVPNFGFSTIYNSSGKLSVTDYKLSAAVGSSSFSAGIGYGWSSGDIDFFHRSDFFTFGTLIRPNRFLSFGLIGNLSTKQFSEAAIDAAVRPFGNEFLTFFGDYVFQEDLPSGNVNWSAGAALEIFPGVRLTGRYFENDFFSVGAHLSFGRIGFSSQTNFNKDAEKTNNIYGIRIGAYDRNPFREILSYKNYLKVDLKGGLKYQKFKLFDDSNTLFQLIQQIETAKNDKTISGITINTSSMNINKEMLWELREKLNEFKKTGKKVVIFIDRINISGYHFASIADKIVMDPLGIITLEGFLRGRQYYKGTLEKIGIGFTELRYFKFKSANETFSRESMSIADSIQWTDIIKNEYRLAKKDICLSRNISEENFDKLVNDEALFLAETALDYGLIDEIGRWDKVEETIKNLEGEYEIMVSPASLAEFNLPEDDYWGNKPDIAVIYAVGATSMDAGINASELIKDVNAAAENSNIKAVVLRIDSPGGDALPADIIAEAIKKCSKKKPVIVSQGYVAASGGYWLSMYADTIISAPVTLTGSIGVIGSWYYNKKLKEYLGVSTDYVKKGKHADLTYGLALPFLGVVLPDRDLTDKEKEKAEKIIKELYENFVSKVSEARDLSYSYVDSIGQGRIWTGYDALDNDLVDMLGGLSTAINVAAEKSGLKGKEYNIVQYPEPPLFDFKFLSPRILSADLDDKKFIEQLKLRFKYNGLPLTILPLDFMDYLEK